ncbi:MAG: homocysteine S-methyltransferase family protein, partial [Bosea sp. (in: a-proteobacteria)]
AVQIETAQDLLQAKAAVIAAKRARAKLGVDLPIFVNVTVETTGTMLLGSEIGAALTTLEALGVDVAPRLTVLKTTEPPGRSAGIRVGSVAELVTKLKNEAGVL